MPRFTSPWSLGLAYTLFVILFGAVVRITGSGAGCGQHWPTCHGEVAHLPANVETAIELTHRVTSGLSLVLVFGLATWTARRHPRRHPARRAGFWACVFMVSEALVGAALVVLELVGENDSWQRAVVMAVHLVNTSLLTLSMLAAAWFFGVPQAEGARRQRGRLGRRRGGLGGSGPAVVGMALILVVSAAGAVTALGDTLYPVEGGGTAPLTSDALGLQFLERLRGVHPILAIGASAYLLGISDRLPRGGFRRAMVWLVVIQVLAGIVNIGLGAPGWMQVVHLALANLLWLALGGVWLQSLTDQGVERAESSGGLDPGREGSTVGP